MQNATHMYFLCGDCKAHSVHDTTWWTIRQSLRNGISHVIFYSPLLSYCLPFFPFNQHFGFGFWMFGYWSFGSLWFWVQLLIRILPVGFVEPNSHIPWRDLSQISMLCYLHRVRVSGCQSTIFGIFTFNSLGEKQEISFVFAEFTNFILSSPSENRFCV